MGWFASARRRELGLTQPEVARRGGPSAALVRQVESGTYKASMQATVRRGYETALRWEAGSIDSILEGGVPAPLPEDIESPSDANARPDRDSINGVMVRATQTEDGLLVLVNTEADAVDGEPGSRLELRFWPGKGRDVSASALAPIAGNAHRAALRVTSPGVSKLPKAGDGNAEDRTDRSPAPNTEADEVSALDDQLPAAAKTGAIEEPGEFNT